MIERLTEHLVTGAVMPIIGQTFDLDHVPDAIRDLAAGRIIGKACIQVRPKP